MLLSFGGIWLSVGKRRILPADSILRHQLLRGSHVTISNLLLLSTTSIHGQQYLHYCRETVAEFLPPGATVAFAPYALADHDTYTDRVRTAFAPLGVSVTGLHTVANPTEMLSQVDAVFVGGGNSFRLLATLQRLQLIEPIRERVTAGALGYMGSSAGTNMACPTLRTTNDMPIVQPDSFDSIGLIPFQINPHYQDPDPTSTHMGETREQRITQFLEDNDVPVLGLREGAWLRRQEGSLILHGTPGARLFQRGTPPIEYPHGTDLSHLLTRTPEFDVRAQEQRGTRHDPTP